MLRKIHLPAGWAGLGWAETAVGRRVTAPRLRAASPRGKVEMRASAWLRSPSLYPSSGSEQRSLPDAATGGKSPSRVTGLVGEDGEAGYNAMKCVMSLHAPSLPCHMIVSYHMISFKAEGFLGVIPEMRQKASRCQQGADEEERHVSSPSVRAAGDWPRGSSRRGTGAWKRQ